MTASHRIVTTSAGLLLALASVACKPLPSDDTGLLTGNESPSGDGDTIGDGDGDGNTGDGDTTGDGPGCASALDILLVVDNSGSMGEGQRRLATAMSGLIDPLDAAGVDWRIAITTSDNGNPWCPPGATTPEAGNFVLSSCQSRLGDFIFNNGEQDASDYACSDICGLESNSLMIAPTPTEVDPTPRTRRWIERIGGVTNLESDVDPAEALACFVPMGINGCGFESQLESSYLALVRAQSPDEIGNYGFLRSDASLLVIIVSDEVDCSYNKSFAEIFEPDGNKVFWSDPGSAFPTSAVCWNAGVACTGDPSGYDSCDPVDHDVTGSTTDNAQNAVLHAVGRYDGLLDGIEDNLRDINPDASVQLSVIGGAALDGGLVYAASSDPTVQNSFGIGFGCSEGNETIVGLPPVRMRDVATHSGGQVRSICANDHAATLAALVDPFVAACP